VDTQSIINDRILEKESESSSASARVASYYVFSQVFPENPILGVGPKTRSNVVQLLHGKAPVIHIGYLCYLYYYGLIGSILIFMAFYYMLKDAKVVGKKYNYWGPYYGIISFLIANTTLVYFNLSEMGIVISMIYVRYFTNLGNQTELGTQAKSRLI
jgi:hypothetical protein